VGYAIRQLYDTTRAVRSGSTLPVKIALCDANNNDVSSSGVVVHATSLVQVVGTNLIVSSPVEIRHGGSFASTTLSSADRSM
jgi:hypothetical protein